MNIEFNSNKLRKQLSSASQIKRNFGVNSKRVNTRLDQIRWAPNLRVLMQLPAAKCHRLSGDRDGSWALNVSANHRIIFEIAQHPLPINQDGSLDTKSVTDVRIMEIVDYH